MKGKREMKRNYTPFAAGMVTMALLFGLIASSFAVNNKDGEPAGSGAAPASIGVGVFLQQQIAPGETLTTENGGSAPKVLAYADSKGETHYYIEATTAAELFDVSGGVHFREEANQLEFGAAPYKNADGQMEWSNELRVVRERTDFLLAIASDDKGNRILTGGNVPGNSGAKTILLADMEPEERQAYWARHKSILADKPEYGVSGGMYTEVDPAEINIGSLSGVSIKDREFHSAEEIRETFFFTSRLGKYAAITIENTGSAEAEIEIQRLHTVGDGGDTFTSIYLPAGEKITRAFRIDENKPVENQLQLIAQPLGEGGVNIKVTAEQYRSGK